jgi:hypothetical protein
MRLKLASQKLNQARQTIQMENKAIRENPDYDPGTDLETEAKRIESAQIDIQEVLKIIDGGEMIITFGKLKESRRKQFSFNDFPYEGIKDELSGVEKDMVKQLDPTLSGTYLALADDSPTGDGTTQEIWFYNGQTGLDETPSSTPVYQIR